MAEDGVVKCQAVRDRRKAETCVAPMAVALGVRLTDVGEGSITTGAVVVMGAFVNAMRLDASAMRGVVENVRPMVEANIGRKHVPCDLHCSFEPRRSFFRYICLQLLLFLLKKALQMKKRIMNDCVGIRDKLQLTLAILSMFEYGTQTSNIYLGLSMVHKTSYLFRRQRIE